MILVAVLVNPIAYGAPPSSSGRAYHPLTNPTVSLNRSDYGAVGDGVTDDGPALQNALEALADLGGGSLFVPEGIYAIATPVAVDFSNRAELVVIQGTPSSSPDDGTGNYGRGLNLTAEFLIKTGATKDAITLKNTVTLLVENLVFIGDPPVLNDARIVLHFSGIENETIHYCEFYGLGDLVPNGAIVAAEDGNFKITDSAFLGCGGNSGTNTPVVRLYNWKGISITGTRFVDFGNRPDFYSKTTTQSPLAWVSVYGAAPLTNESPRRDIIISDVLFDEGAYIALLVLPDAAPVPNGGAISLVWLSDLFVNVSNLGEVSLLIRNVDNVFIENSHFGWSHNSRGAMELGLVKNALLNQIDCVLSADTIIALGTVQELSIINSTYQTLDSEAPITRVISTADPANGPARYVTQKYFDVLGHAPDIPGYVYWSQRRARCNDNAQCTTDEELLAYLNSHPTATFSIRGQLLDDDGFPLASAKVSLSGTHQVATVTDSEGQYSFSGLATGGDYTVTPSKAFYTFKTIGGSPGTSSRSFIAPPGDQTASFTGTVTRYSIAGRVNDSNGQATGGVTMTLTGGPPGFNPPAGTTNSGGAYSFTGVPAGFTYSLTAEKDFYDLNPSVRTLTLTGPTVNLNFVATRRVYSIAGTVTEGTSPLSNATITLSGNDNRSTATDANGAYHFDGVVAGGNYTFTAKKQGYAFAPPSVSFIALDQNVHPNFNASRLPILLLTEGHTNRAIAFNSISMLREPFDLFTTPFDFGPDRRTRIILFALSQNFPASPTITAQAEDSLGNDYPLAVEFTQPLPAVPSIMQINVRLNRQIPIGGDVKLTINVDGLVSNTVVVKID
jgi:hypothetical protein